MGLLVAIAGLIVLSSPFLFGFFVAWLAKKLHKNPWLFGVAGFSAIAVAVYFNFVALLANVTVDEISLLGFLYEKHEETVFVKLEDTKKVVLKQSVAGIGFDVPLTYTAGRYNPPAYEGLNISKSQYEGKIREARSYISIKALLPDIEPMSEANYKLFAASNGKDGPQIEVTLGKQPSTPTDFFFKNFFPKLEKQPTDPSVPGMLHYYESLGMNGRDSIYLSGDHASSDLTEIRCTEFKPEPVNPKCDVTTYLDYKGHRFGLGYEFAPSHLSEWREIDRKVKAVIKGFGVAAQNAS